MSNIEHLRAGHEGLKSAHRGHRGHTHKKLRYDAMQNPPKLWPASVHFPPSPTRATRMTSASLTMLSARNRERYSAFSWTVSPRMVVGEIHVDSPVPR